MEYRPIEVKLICGKDLKDVNVFSTMDVYVVGSVSGDPRSMQQTAVHKDGGINPTWNHVMRFNVDESAARLNRLGLVFQIMSNRTLGDKEVGRVYVPLKELFDAVGVNDDHSGEISGEDKNVIYQVQTSTGRFKGQLEFSYKLGEKFTHTFEQKLETNVLPLDRKANDSVFPLEPKINESKSTSNQKSEDEPIMAYPPGPSPMTGPYPGHVPGSHPGPYPGYAPGPYPGNAPGPYPGHAPGPYSGHAPGPHPGPMPESSKYPGVGVEGSAPYNYGGPPSGYPQQGYGYGYGYPTQQPPPPPNAQMGYNYGYPGGGGYGGYPGQPSTGFVQQPVKQHKKKGSKFGLGSAAGLGAGLLGGLLVGEMVEDVADAAVYDDMYDF